MAFTGQFPNKCPLIYLFKVNLSKSEDNLELLDNSKMKRTCQLILLRDTITVYHITLRKDAAILKVTVATVLCKHLTTQMLLSRDNILKLCNHLQ